MPTIEDLISNPTLEIPRAELASLLEQIKHAEGVILARLLADATPSAARASDGDRGLTVDEAAKVLGVTRGWLYGRGRKLGLAVEMAPGTLRFSMNAIQQFMHERAVKPAATRKKRAA